ncbi:glycosyltransferase family 2 protein [Methanobacterium sp. ACI-7]|uniref:glycosyltransferase family 2 protein n=1 Tax=unclassified Methanobacterium TaxID=2627676 RepID=UPI0039C1642A
MVYPDVSIVILNWNGWRDTLECLESVYQINYPNYNVIVVDNGSEDNSIEKIKEYAEGKIKVKSDFFKYNPDNKPLKVIEYSKNDLEFINVSEIEDLSSNQKLILIKNDENYGFAEGNNIAMRYILKSLNSDYILLLNNDTVVDKNFLANLVKHGENKNTGILGPTVCYYNEPDNVSISGGNIIFSIGAINYVNLNKNYKNQDMNEKNVDYISGCSLLIKNEVCKKTGLLNSDYFLYYEDTEWCLRAKSNGYNVLYVPESRIWHKESTAPVSNVGVYYLTRNRFWFIKKYANNLQYFSFFIFFFIFYFWAHNMRHLLYYRDIKRLYSFYNGIVDGIKT